ncbi:MAG: hypothetical protein ABEH83_01810 [Halobacterium sp.]
MVEAPLDDEDDPDAAVDESFVEHHERMEDIKRTQGELKQAWQDTLEDMEALAEERRADGFDVTAIAAVDAGPIGRDTTADEGEFGMEFVIPDNRVDDFVDAFEAGDYPEYDVFRAEQASDAFIVEELRDPDAGRVILLAGAYALRDVTTCAYAARKEDEMYTFVRTLDGTRYGAFRHEGYRKFFPRADELPEDPVEVAQF